MTFIIPVVSTYAAILHLEDGPVLELVSPTTRIFVIVPLFCVLFTEIVHGTRYYCFEVVAEVRHVHGCEINDLLVSYPATVQPSVAYFCPSIIVFMMSTLF